jgi:hypothetical protein
MRISLLRGIKMKKFRDILDESTMDSPFKKEGPKLFLNIQSLTNWIRIDYSQGELVQFLNKIKMGNSKKKILIQLGE